jgi:oligoendopeptidase F
MTATTFLDFLNTEFNRLHHEYEVLFWDAYMGTAKVGKKKDKALAALDTFRGNSEHKATAEALVPKATGTTKERLLTWVRFFDVNQVPAEAAALRTTISELETTIQQKRSTQIEGYIDPAKGEFVVASSLKMRTMMQTHGDEAMRKACFEAREQLALTCLSEYVELVQLRNQFARLLGYTDFYDYKLRHIDSMTKDELFAVFGEIAEAVQPNFAKVRALEKTKKGIRKPWNYGYMMTGDFTHEEEPYYQFGEAVSRWLESFSKLGVSFAGGTLTLDLVERKGKHNNGFCHWPDLVHYTGSKRHAGSANFTCNVTPHQVGSGEVAYMTLFHEGGHAAHFLNVTQRDICLNHEYAPMTAAWAETQSMFMDTLYASQEWRSRYAKNDNGEVYPWELFEHKTKATALVKPARIMSIIFLSTFERQIYELKKPTTDKVLKIAKTVYKNHFDHTVDSLFALTKAHIYSWDSACSYHGYGLAEIALHQWRDYFHKKYGYIVDNGAIGKEMTEAWTWGARYDFKTALKKATGQKLSPNALIRFVMSEPEATIQEAKKRSKLMDQNKTKITKPNATIRLVHGKKLIADSSEGLEVMAKRYKEWFLKLR